MACEGSFKFEFATLALAHIALLKNDVAECVQDFALVDGRTGAPPGIVATVVALYVKVGDVVHPSSGRCRSLGHHWQVRNTRTVLLDQLISKIC